MKHRDIRRTVVDYGLEACVMAGNVEQATVVQRFGLAQQAYDALREMIVDGKIPPGSRLTVRPIAEQLGLSATPVTAAMMKLEREGFLISKLHRGYFVPEISIQDMSEIYEMREALDRLAGGRAAASAQHFAIAEELRANCELQREFLELDDVDAYRRTDVEFHEKLWVLCGNKRIRDTGEQLLGQMKLGNSLSARLPGRVRKSLEEHLAIVEAIERADLEAAQSAASRHMASVRMTFMTSISEPEES